MQYVARIAVSLFLLSTAYAAAYQSSIKLRRDGVLNLYPFPRVGRASHQTWEVPLNDFYLEYKPSEKRQLYAFPRVGRSELHSDENQIPFRIENMLFGHRSHPNTKRESESSDNPGMWFGPRVGRSYRSQIDDTFMNTDRSDPEHIDPEQIDERQKRQAKQ